jgi:hypothetical protein
MDEEDTVMSNTEASMPRIAYNILSNEWFGANWENKGREKTYI